MFLAVTICVNGACAFLFPELVSDSFNPQVFAVCITPSVWGWYIFLVYRTRREKFVSYAGLAGGMFWLAPAVGLAIEFALK